MTDILSVQDLIFSYGRHRVLTNVSLTASPGEVTCLLGPNGCGKTTLLDCIMALHKPESGRVMLSGRNIEQVKRHEIARKIAYVPQIHDVTFPYTVREIVLMGRTAYAGAFSRPTQADEQLADAAIERIGIAHYADTPYSRLSGGEIKLVLLARALAQKSRLLLLDEPTAHLDMNNELRFLQTLAELCRDESITAIMATHAPEHAFYFEAQGLPVKAAMMSGGHVAYTGRPEQVITAENILSVYGIHSKIVRDDENGTKTILKLASM